MNSNQRYTSQISDLMANNTNEANENHSNTNEIPKRLIHETKQKLRNDFGEKNLEFTSLDYVWELTRAQKVNKVEGSVVE